MNDWDKSSINRRTIPLIRVGEVVDITDPYSAGLIKVRITGFDDPKVPIGQLDTCVPLLPKFLTTMPKLGESVFVFQADAKKGPVESHFSSTRFWIGPLISQLTTLDDDPKAQATSMMPDGWGKLQDPKIQPGTYGNKKDIILQGRKNTDLIFKEDEIWLRAGKYRDGADNIFNNRDVGYIQLKYGSDKLKKEIVDKKIVEYVWPVPNVVIYAKIITYVDDPSSVALTALSNKLPLDRYTRSDVKKTTINIKVKYGGSTFATPPPPPFTQEFLGQSSRNMAINAAKNYIDTRKQIKWKIKCDAPDLLNSYPNAKNGTAIFSITPKEVSKIVKTTVINRVPNVDKHSSVINMVASKINLLSYDGNNFKLTNPEKLITDEEQEKINNEAHPLVYGDTLVNFLGLVKDFINLHTHPYHGLPPDNSDVKLDVLRFDLNSILNKNINSN